MQYQSIFSCEFFNFDNKNKEKIEVFEKVRKFPNLSFPIVLKVDGSGILFQSAYHLLQTSVPKF